MGELWLTDPKRWAALPLAVRLESLRKRYCTGPCGQDGRTVNTRAALDKALREAIDALEKDLVFD